MVIHKTFADFVLFLYVHIAHADGEYHALEENVILGKVQKFFPDEAEARTKLRQAAEQYRATPAADVPGIIRDTFKHYRHVKFAQKYRIYTDMYDIINADGRVDESETQAVNELKEIINLASAR
jgi:uncharacterized tellurite resistance protein B-like protein